MSEIQLNIRRTVGRVLRYVEDEIGVEDIDGTTPTEAAKFVDLSVGYTPVVTRRWHGHWDIPKPDKVQTDGKRFCVVWPEHHDFQIIGDMEHRIARARYLLLHGLFYRHFKAYSYPDQRKIIAWYFDGVMWRPDPKSPMSAAMELADAETQQEASPQ